MTCWARRGCALRSPHAAGQPLRLASMAKPVTAVATLMLVEDGKLPLDRAVDRGCRSWRTAACCALPAARSTTPFPRSGHHRAGPAHAALGPGRGDGEARHASHPAGHERSPGVARLPSAHGSARRIHRRRAGCRSCIDRESGRPIAPATKSSGVLVARASGMRFDDFLRERLFVPLGMKDAAFTVPAEKLDRLTTAYARDDSHGGSGCMGHTGGQLLVTTARVSLGRRPGRAGVHGR